MSKHTPGPWKVTGYEPHNKVIASYGDGKQPVHFDVALCHLEVAIGTPQANARLIAAAPELLEACKAVLLFHSGAEWDAGRPEEWKRITGEVLATTKSLCDHIRKCLQKAEVPK